MNAPLSKEQIALLMSDRVTVRSAPASRPALFARLSTAYRAWSERRAVMAELRGLTDRELTDIGLNRSDLGRVFDPAYAQARDEALFRSAHS